MSYSNRSAQFLYNRWPTAKMGKIVTTGQEMWDLAAYRKLSNEAGRYNVGFVRNRTPGYHRLSEMVLDAYV